VILSLAYSEIKKLDCCCNKIIWYAVDSTVPTPQVQMLSVLQSLHGKDHGFSAQISQLYILRVWIVEYAMNSVFIHQMLSTIYRNECTKSGASSLTDTSCQAVREQPTESSCQLVTTFPSTASQSYTSISVRAVNKTR
jgi:hypothetical protein